MTSAAMTSPVEFRVSSSADGSNSSPDIVPQAGESRQIYDSQPPVYKSSRRSEILTRFSPSYFSGSFEHNKYYKVYSQIVIFSDLKFDSINLVSIPKLYWFKNATNPWQLGRKLLAVFDRSKWGRPSRHGVFFLLWQSGGQNSPWWKEAEKLVALSL